MNRNFKLFMCRLGNGITVCNSAVKESGDYKYIAHISNNGKIKYYVSEGYIPIEDMQRIEQTAAEQRQKFIIHWNKLTDIQKYEKILDSLTISEFVEAINDKGIALADKVKCLEEKYLFTKDF